MARCRYCLGKFDSVGVGAGYDHDWSDCLNGMVERHNRYAEALREISKGEGVFSRDPLTHATNTIDSMKQIARDALSADQPADQPST